MRSPLLLLLGPLIVDLSLAFAPSPSPNQESALSIIAASTMRTRHCDLVVDPNVLNSISPAEMTTLVAAAVGAATGAASQQPRILQLERDLIASRLALNQTEMDMETKMNALQDQLFEMDQEYEAQTARFKRQYDTQIKEELQRTANKMKQEYEFKLEIALNQERSAKLSKQLVQVNGGIDREAELSRMRIQQEQIQKANVKLEQALQDSEQELRRMRHAASTKKKLFGLF